MGKSGDADRRLPTRPSRASWRTCSPAMTTARLVGWRTAVGWHDLRSSEVNAYLRDVVGEGTSAKDFRTWNATVLMAQRLALTDRPGAPAAQRMRVVRAAYADVAEYLGNTPAVAKASYVDPRVVDLFLSGTVIPAEVLPARRSDARPRCGGARRAHAALRGRRAHGARGLTSAAALLDRAEQLGLGHARAALDAEASRLAVELGLRPTAGATMAAQAAASTGRDVVQRLGGSPWPTRRGGRAPC